MYVGLGNGSLAVFDKQDPGTYPGNGSMDVAGNCTVQVLPGCKSKKIPQVLISGNYLIHSSLEFTQPLSKSAPQNHVI